MSETQFSKSVRATLKRLGVWHVRVQSGTLPVVYARNGKTHYVHCAEEGTPDHWTELGWLESKVDDGELNDAQKRWHAKAKARGVRVEAVWSVADVVRVVRAWRGQ